MSDDPKLSQRYRELPREEPPRALDDAILAASRRAVGSHPAPLVAPTGRRRWYFPVAAAAVIVLAVVVVAHIDREQPNIELATAPASALEPSPPAAAEERKAEAPQKPARRAEAPRQEADRVQPQFAPDPRADSSAPAAAAPAPKAESAPPPSEESKRAAAQAAESAARDRERNASDRLARGASQPMSTSVSSAAPALARIARSPEQWLQGILDLRRQGRHEEADRELAEFRKRYPDYRLSDEMKAKVERPQ